jgi:uncharacterized delta-60 repeat protein
VVLRYNSDGSLDTTFGNGGREVITFPSNDSISNGVTALALAPGGTLVVGGFAQDPNTFRENYFLERLQSNGAPDANFGTGGQLITTIFNGPNGSLSFGGGVALAVRPDGRIVVGAAATDFATFPSQSFFALAQFTASGAVDTSFGNDGLALASSDSGPNQVSLSLSAIALQPDGDVVVVGTATSFLPTGPAGAFVVTRFQANGSVDSTFGSDGWVTVGFSGGVLDAATAVLVNADGTIVVAGYTRDPNSLPYDYALLELNPDGSLVWGNQHRNGH